MSIECCYCPVVSYVHSFEDTDDHHIIKCCGSNFIKCTPGWSFSSLGCVCLAFTKRSNEVVEDDDIYVVTVLDDDCCKWS